MQQGGGEWLNVHNLITHKLVGTSERLRPKEHCENIKTALVQAKRNIKRKKSVSSCAYLSLIHSQPCQDQSPYRAGEAARKHHRPHGCDHCTVNCCLRQHWRMLPRAGEKGGGVDLCVLFSEWHLFSEGRLSVSWSPCTGANGQGEADEGEESFRCNSCHCVVL